MKQFMMTLDTIKQRQKMVFPMGNRKILVTYVNGNVYAMNDKCPHMGSSLLNGKLEEGVITCKDHGLPISVVTGEVTDQAKAEFLKMDEYSRSVRCYKVIIEDGKVYLDV